MICDLVQCHCADIPLRCFKSPVLLHGAAESIGSPLVPIGQFRSQTSSTYCPAPWVRSTGGPGNSGCSVGCLPVPCDSILKTLFLLISRKKC